MIRNAERVEGIVGQPGIVGGGYRTKGVSGSVEVLLRQVGEALGKRNLRGMGTQFFRVGVCVQGGDRIPFEQLGIALTYGRPGG